MDRRAGSCLLTAALLRGLCWESMLPLPTSMPASKFANVPACPDGAPLPEADIGLQVRLGPDGDAPPHRQVRPHQDALADGRVGADDRMFPDYRIRGDLGTLADNSPSVDPCGQVKNRSRLGQVPPADAYVPKPMVGVSFPERRFRCVAPIQPVGVPEDLSWFVHTASIGRAHRQTHRQQANVKIQAVTKRAERPSIRSMVKLASDRAASDANAH